MAIIGVPYVCFEDSISGRIEQIYGVNNVSATVNYIELSRINKNYKMPTTATVSINFVDTFTFSYIRNYARFKVPGTLRWVVKTMTGGSIAYTIYEIKNVVLSAPSVSAVTKQENITFTSYDISGQSFKCDGMRERTSASLEAAIIIANRGLDYSPDS